MQAEIKEFRRKAKNHYSTTDYCGKLILTADHEFDAMLLAMLWRALFQLGKTPEVKHGRQELAAWLLDRIKIQTPEAEELRAHLAKLKGKVKNERKRSSV